MSLIKYETFHDSFIYRIPTPIESYFYRISRGEETIRLSKGGILHISRQNEVKTTYRYLLKIRKLHQRKMLFV
jgi:hypothetical protein